MWIVWRAKSMLVAICGSPTILLLKPEGYPTECKAAEWCWSSRLLYFDESTAVLAGGLTVMQNVPHSDISV